MTALPKLTVLVSLSAVARLCPAATLSLLPIDAFGKTMSNCRIDSLRRSDPPNSDSAEPTASFEDLSALQLPLGTYEVVILCKGESLRQTVTFDHPDQLILVIRRERVAISDHTKPKLSIKITNLRKEGHTWWVSLVGLYTNQKYVSRFSMSSRIAEIIDPEPGSYLVTVRSTEGYSCLHQVDLVEFTRNWEVDPNTCDFRVDQFAHLVEAGKQTPGIGPWYDEMRRQKQELFENLLKATER